MSTDNSKPSMIKPGILVALSTKVEGGVEYKTADADLTETAEEVGVSLPAAASAEAKAWSTLKIVEDAAEHEAAIKVRSKARSLITGVTIATPFGQLCPLDKVAALDAAIDAAKKAASEFNAGAKTCRVGVWILKGQIASSDDEAVKGIAAEIKSLLADMQDGITKRDEKIIRDAAKKAGALSAMLEEEHAERVTAAVKTARAAAREIVKTIKERGDANLVLVADTKLKDLRAAEQAFLDLEAPQAIDGEVLAPAVGAEVDDLGVLAFEPASEPADPGVAEIDETPNPDDVDASFAVDRDIGELAAGAPDDAPDLFEV